MTFELFLKRIGKNIAAARKAHSLPQKEASKQAGISYRYYQSIEAGKANITIATLFKLAKFYSMFPTDLLPLKTDT